MAAFHKTLLPSVATLIFALVTLTGCSENGPARTAIWGNVTWKGQPVPSGIVYFGPDSTKENKGPQGFALIKNGTFDTRGERSKGCMTGPHIATIQGADGQGITSGRPYGSSLFASYELKIDVPAEGGTIDLVVPDSAIPAAKNTEPE